LNLKRSLALALAALLVLTVIPVFGAGETLDRIKGANRWATAVEISQEGWDSASVVVLANGEKFADALAGVPLAFANDAPILLTASNSLNKEAKDEIVRLGANKVFLLGGTAAISEEIEEELVDMGLEVDRVKGATRDATAVEIANRVAPNGVDTVVLAYAWDFPDALAAASYAAINGYPILLSEKTSISEATEKAIEDLGVENVIIVGGSAVITDKVEDALEDDGYNVDRVNGSNREGTSVALAEFFKLNTTKYFVATGDDFADAIAGAALAAKEGTGILLVRKSLHKVIADFVEENVTEAVIFGGTGAVSDSVAKNIEGKLLTGIGGIVGWTTAEEVVIAGKTVKPDTDNGGFFKITGIAPGTHKAYFKGEGRETKPVDVVVVQDRLTVVDATYGDAIEDEAIQGVVIDKETGEPLKAAIGLEVWNEDDDKWEDGTGIAAAADTGIFKLDKVTNGIEAGGKYRVTIKMIDAKLEKVYREKVYTVTLAKDEGAKDLGLIELETVKPMTITGVVKDAEGNVVAEEDDLVKLTAFGKEVSADTDEDGKFEFADLTLPTGKYTLSVDDGTHAVYTATISVTEGQDRVHNVNLKYGYDITFELRTATTDDLELSDNAVAKIEGVGNMTKTADANEFTATLAPGNYTVTVSDNFVITQKYTIKVTDGDATIAKQITPAGGIEVTTGDYKTFVEILDKDDKVVASGDIDAEGTKVFGGLPVGGKYTIRASAENKKTKHFKDADAGEVLEIAANNNATFTVELEDVDKDGKVSGYVRFADGYPAEGAKVTYYYNDVKDKTKGNVADTCTVATTGFYQTLPLDPGTYDVVIRADGHETYEGSMTIKAGDNKQFVNYRLVAGGNAKLELVVKDKAGKLVDVSSLTLKDAFGEEYTLANDNDDAPTKFVATGLPAGKYTLTRNADGENAKLAEKIVISKGATVKANYKLVAPASEHEVTIWVVDEDYADVTDAKVVIGSKVVEYIDNGEYTVELVNGTYTAEIYLAGYLMETVNFTVKDADLMLPQVQLTPAK
jgi:putative cell wall-binding protein